MASSTATKATTASKPAKAGTEGGIGVKELADKLGTNARTLRGFLREQGMGIGRGERYGWKSMADPAVKKIAAAGEKAGEQAE
jgi:phage antirepressor YoqD-like protein